MTNLNKLFDYKRHAHKYFSCIDWSFHHKWLFPHHNLNSIRRAYHSTSPNLNIRCERNSFVDFLFHNHCYKDEKFVCRLAFLFKIYISNKLGLQLLLFLIFLPLQIYSHGPGSKKPNNLSCKLNCMNNWSAK